MRLLTVGSHALLVEVDDTTQALALAAWARSQGLARDVVPGAATVLLDGLAEGAAERVPGYRAALQTPGPRPEPIEIPVRYDGPDLDLVAAQWGCPVDEVAARHQATEFLSAFCGFAPGFAYLSGLTRDVPRLATPRTRVPAGSVALAGTWCGVYPRASPGGWLIIGSTDLELWDPQRAEPARLAPGTQVRFVGQR